MRIAHIAAECYPAAKAGGLGDVAGALPKYLQAEGHDVAVIIPGYHTKWILEQDWEEVFSTTVRMLHLHVPCRVMECNSENLGFTLFAIYIPGFFDRPGIYMDPGSGHGYGDETERWLLFQQAALKFVQFIGGIDILHCHDHHTGLIPFMVKHCPEYRSLAQVPTIFTIHNGQYHGSFSWDKAGLLPWYDAQARGLLEWDHVINPLAAGIKCCWRLTTVSNGYLNELYYQANGLETLLRQEAMKSVGIVNGIDSLIWDPKTDPMIDSHLKEDVTKFKNANRQALKKHFQIRDGVPLITFIGRLVFEKGVDLLPEAIFKFISEGGEAAFVILGTGEPGIRDAILHVQHHLSGFVDTSIQYNETLSHQLYAGSDFLVMPSRVEPCGLNQLYSFRYGTIPLVRNTGGLAETVIDLSEENGNGFKFNDANSDAIAGSFHRAAALYREKKVLQKIRQHILHLDFSWEKAARHYLHVYFSVKPPSA